MVSAEKLPEAATGLRSPVAVLSSSLGIGTATLLTTVFWGQNAGVIVFAILCGIYFAAVLNEGRKIFEAIVAAGLCVLLAGIMAWLLGFVLVNHILTI